VAYPYLHDLHFISEAVHAFYLKYQTHNWIESPVYLSITVEFHDKTNIIFNYSRRRVQPFELNSNQGIDHYLPII
jgi:hypothetical protein